MMISINLLPPELRHKERTPIVIFLPIILGLAAVLSAGAVAAYVHFAWLTEAVNESRRLQDEVAQRKSQLTYEEKLLKEETEYKKRSDTIREIASSRTLMTRKLDQLCDVVTAGEKEGSFLVWLQDAKTSPPKAQAGGARGKGPAPAKPGGEIYIKGFALADRDPLQHYNRFHAALTASDLYRECLNIENPDGKIQDFSDEKTPKKGWTIDLKMTMMHATDLAKLRAKAKPGAIQVAERTPGSRQNAPR